MCILVCLLRIVGVVQIQKKKSFFYFKLLFTIKSSNSLDPDQAKHQNIGPDLGPNCLQRFSADDKSLLPWKELIYPPKYLLAVTFQRQPTHHNQRMELFSTKQKAETAQYTKKPL